MPHQGYWRTVSKRRDVRKEILAIVKEVGPEFDSSKVLSRYLQMMKIKFHRMKNPKALSKRGSKMSIPHLRQFLTDRQSIASYVTTLVNRLRELSHDDGAVKYQKAIRNFNWNNRHKDLPQRTLPSRLATLDAYIAWYTERHIAPVRDLLKKPAVGLSSICNNRNLRSMDERCQWS